MFSAEKMTRSLHVNDISNSIYKTPHKRFWLRTAQSVSVLGKIEDCRTSQYQLKDIHFHVLVSKQKGAFHFKSDFDNTKIAHSSW